MSGDPLDAARKLLPLILTSRDATEAGRQIAAPVVDGIRAARLARIGLPREVGGLELPLSTALHIYECLAGAEASVGWIVWNNALPSYFGRFFPRDVRAEVFGDPDWLYAGSTRPSGRAEIEGDGYRVSGRWALVSGCELAEWIAVRCAITQGGVPRMIQPGVPEVRMVYLRRGAFRVLDTWHTGGLRGTGSHDIEVDAQLVPRRLTLSPADGSTLDGTLGRLPIVCTMAAGYGAQLLGLGQACIDALLALSRDKPVVDPGPGLGERPAVLAMIAEHDVRLRAARDHLHACVTASWQEAERGAPTIGCITAVFGAAHHAMAQGRAAVSAAYAAAGASALYTSSPLERAHRDMHAMAAHLIAQPFWMEDTGRVLLGRDPVNPLYRV